MNTKLVYVTAGSREQAVAIATQSVEKRLAACANILGEATSIYWWEDKLQNDTETVLILKTTEKNLDALISKIKQIHDYDCPCVVAFDITSGNPDFLNWIERKTN